MNLSLKSLSLGLVFCATWLVAGDFLVVGKTDKESGIYAKGEKITFSIQALEDGKPVTGVKAKYRLFYDGVRNVDGEALLNGEPFTVEAQLDYAGWVYVNCWLKDAEGKNIDLKRGSSNGVGALVAPEELTCAAKEPADFDEFWKAQRALLDTVPVKATREEVPSRNPAFVTYDVKVDCAGSKPVSGYLSIPKDAAPKSCPVVVSYHGAGVRSSNKPYRNGAVCFDVNAHGIPNGQPGEYYEELNKGELRDYRTRNSNNRETIYFRDMYLRVMRALDYVKTLPEWDGKRLIVTGGSQGGAQSIVAAALDHDVSMCVAGVPAVSDHTGSIAKPPHKPGWPTFYFAKDGVLTPAQEAIAKAVEYYDNVHFAKRIKCDTYISTGFNDTTCAPVGVWLVYHNLPKECQKGLTMTPAGNHGTSPNTAGNKAIDEAVMKK